MAGMAILLLYFLATLSTFNAVPFERGGSQRNPINNSVLQNADYIATGRSEKITTKHTGDEIDFE